ncbi:MAG: EamA family transporter [Tissierellia bacterium]|nr:EamA family transporter [Tissierellia bacterium]
MWVIYAFGSALFAGLTAVLAKIGIKNTDSNLATAIRTIVVLIFSWIMVYVVGAQEGMSRLDNQTVIFLVLSGLATGASWLCYFKALQLGDVNKVAPIDKSSTILTMILAMIFLGEKLTLFKLVAMILIGLGTLLMIKTKPSLNKQVESNSWLFFAILSVLFASLTSILGKIGIENIDSNLGTAIRTIVVLIMAWGIVFGQKKQKQIKNIDKTSWVFLILSGLATGASWLCYYRALQDGPASIVVPIDKLSIVVTVAFSFIFLREKLNVKSFIGLLLIVAGTLILII